MNAEIESLETRRMLAGLLSISIADLGFLEGDTGTRMAVFTVRLNGLSVAPVSVQYATADGTARSGSDYLATTGSIVMTPGQSAQSFSIPIVSDRSTEGDETFFVKLSNPVGAPLERSAATGTIVDDNRQTITIKVQDASASELKADQGVFRISREGPIDKPLKVLLSVGGTASNGEDFQRVNRFVIIPAKKEFASVKIKPLDDGLSEPDETVVMKLRLSTAYLIGSPKSATVKIKDRDASAPTAALTAGDITTPLTNPHQFIIQYSDDRQMNGQTIGEGDLHVVGPNGFLKIAELVSRTPMGNARQITAVYEVDAPEGGWTTQANGTYTVSTLPQAVADKQGNHVLAGALGTFRVVIV